MHLPATVGPVLPRSRCHRSDHMVSRIGTGNYSEEELAPCVGKITQKLFPRRSLFGVSGSRLFVKFEPFPLAGGKIPSEALDRELGAFDGSLVNDGHPPFAVDLVNRHCAADFA